MLWVMYSMIRFPLHFRSRGTLLPVKGSTKHTVGLLMENLHEMEVCNRRNGVSS